MSKERGIYCIETVWYSDESEWFGEYDRTSVRGLLQMLESISYLKVPFVLRDASTPNELYYYLEEWLSGPADECPILYLGFHGSQGGKLLLHTADRMAVSVDYESIQNRLKGRCKNRLVHFSACSAMQD